MPPNNGRPHVSLEVGIEDTKHEGLFSLKKLFFSRFTTWSIVGIQANLEYSWDPGLHCIHESWQL